MIYKIAVVGGGISGLSTAFYLLKFAREKNILIDLSLIEKNKDLGGCLGTKFLNSCLVEEGAESFLSIKEGAINLAKELGIETELIETNAEQRKSFIYSENKLREMPEGLYLFAPSHIRKFLFSSVVTLKGKLRILCEWMIKPRKEITDESIGDFVERRFGKECLERLAQPMIGGIYGGDIRKISLRSTFPNVMEMEIHDGGVIRGLRKKRKLEAAESKASGPRYGLFLTFKKGMGFLIDTLRNHLGVQIQFLNHHILSLGFNCGESKIEINAHNNEKLIADQLCIATSAKDAALLVQGLDGDIAKQLEMIDYESSVTVNFLYKISEINKPKGFGFVVPNIERSPLLGCTFVSNKFSHRTDSQTFLLRCFLATSTHPQLLEMADDQLAHMAKLEVNKMLDLKSEPYNYYVKKYEKVLPQYHVGHSVKIALLNSKLTEMKPLFLTGNYFNGTGVPDCISNAKKTAKIMIDELAIRRESGSDIVSSKAK